MQGSHIGRGNLQLIIKDIQDSSLIEVSNLTDLAFSDLIWDQIVTIGEFDFSGYVYDFSVPGNESFVCENIVAHNTRELQLPKFLYWAPLVVREPNPEGKGEVDMLDLLINSLRMRPDRIILGEIRKQEQAEVLFEAMHTGHSVYATVHADSMAETIRRLVNPPINVPPNLLSAVNLNVVMFRDRRRGIRRIFQVGEYVSVEDGKEVRANLLYRYRPADDQIVEHAEPTILYEDLSTYTGMSIQELMEDLAHKEKILNWMVKNKIRKVNEVGELMQKYYNDPKSVLKNEK